MPKAPSCRARVSALRWLDPVILEVDLAMVEPPELHFEAGQWIAIPLGEKTVQLEKKLATLKRENEMRRQQMAMLQSLPYLDARVKELKLGLGVPTPDQILTLVEGQVARIAPRNAPVPVLTAMNFPADKTYLAYATKALPPPSRKR